MCACVCLPVLGVGATGTDVTVFMSQRRGRDGGEGGR